VDGGTVLWRFYGYVTPAGNREVQNWFDGLSEEEADEVKDGLRYLQLLPRDLWRRPEFDQLDSDISEVRFRVSGRNIQLRLYGSFWPERQRNVYTFLLGKKQKGNERSQGKEGSRESARQTPEGRSQHT
jgi:hypothetical protein